MPEGHFHEILRRTDEQPRKQMRPEATSTRVATTAARHAGRAAELAWPPSSHADIVEARGASLWRPAVVMTIEMLEQQAVVKVVAHMATRLWSVASKKL